eukprot:scaffold1475_cov111-Cylindrotheca_fusiformis.AAC.4
MDIPIDLLCGPVASFLDRASINNLLLTSKVVKHQLEVMPMIWPWPNAARFFNQAYAKRILFSPNGQWLVYSDMRGGVSLWERRKGKYRSEETSLDWINLLSFSASSTWLACANTMDEGILLFHFPSQAWLPPVKGKVNMQSMTFVDETLCIAGDSGVLIWNLGDTDLPTMLLENNEGLSESSPFRLLQLEGSFKFLSPINGIEPMLGAASNDNQLHVWNLRDASHSFLLSPEATGHRRSIMAISQVHSSSCSYDESSNGYLAAAVRCMTTRSAFIELWSCIDNTRMKKIPLDYNLRMSSMVMMNHDSWAIADTTIDQVRIWRNEVHYACCIANPTRMDVTLFGTTIAWIGRGSMLWLRNLDTL